MTGEDLVAELSGITSLDAAAAQQVIEVARREPAQAAGLLQAYEAANADGTPSTIERAWAVLQVGLGIVMPLASALETLAGVPGAVKSL